MREPLLHPASGSVAVSADDHRSRSCSQHKRNQEEPRLAETLVILRMRDGLQSAGKEDRQRHQNAEGPDVEDALHGPNCQLGGEGKIGATRNQIRANEFSRASQQGQSRKTDQCRRYQFSHLGFRAHGSQEYLPAKGAHYIAGINEQNAMNHMPFPDAVRLAPERGPVKGPPVSILQVDENNEYAEHHYAGKNALLIHEG